MKICVTDHKARRYCPVRGDSPGNQMTSLQILLLFLVLFTPLHLHASSPFFPEITAGEKFLTNLFDPGLELLPEYRGAKVYWLYHDNYLAAKLLTNSYPEMARRIRAGMQRFGVSQSGKIEILFGEAPDPFPFRNYQLLDVTNVSGKLIRTERVTPTLLKGWDAYADLLLMAVIVKSKDAPREADAYFQKALALWDGHGFADPASKKNGIYATYKLALGLLAAHSINQKPPFQPAAIAQLKMLQSPAGGWITDYDARGKPHGLPNVETTCLVLLALGQVQ